MTSLPTIIAAMTLTLAAVPTFDSDRIMIKHGAEYRPPAVDPSH